MTATTSEDNGETRAKDTGPRGDLASAIEGYLVRFEPAPVPIREASEAQVRLAAETGKRTTQLLDRHGSSGD